MAKKRYRTRGLGSIYYDKAKGIWRAQVSYKDETGKSRMKSRQARTQEEAVQVLARLQLEFGTTCSSSDVPTVGVWIDYWRETILPMLGVSDATSEQYRHMAGHLTSIRYIPLPTLTIEDVERLLSTMSANGMSRNTCRLAKQTLSHVLTEAERRGHVTRNVAKLARLPATARRVKERRSLSPDEAKKLEAAFQEIPESAMWMCMLLLGLRPGEAVALKWQDVDTNNKVLYVAGARKWTPNGYVIGATKTRRSVRSLAMPPKLIEAFTRMEKHGDDDLCFPGRWGGVKDSSAMRHQLSRICNAACVTPITPYELRHTAASLLSDAGVPIEVLADLLGHTTTTMLEQVYRHRVRKLIDPGTW